MLLDGTPYYINLAPLGGFRYGLFWILDRLHLSEDFFPKIWLLDVKTCFTKILQVRWLTWNLQITQVIKENHLPEKTIIFRFRPPWKSSRFVVVNPHQSEESTMDLRKDNCQADQTLIYGFTINPLWPNQCERWWRLMRWRIIHLSEKWSTQHPQPSFPSRVARRQEHCTTPDAKITLTALLRSWVTVFFLDTFATLFFARNPGRETCMNWMWPFPLDLLQLKMELRKVGKIRHFQRNWKILKDSIQPPNKKLVALERKFGKMRKHHSSTQSRRGAFRTVGGQAQAPCPKTPWLYLRKCAAKFFWKTVNPLFISHRYIRLNAQILFVRDWDFFGGWNEPRIRNQLEAKKTVRTTWSLKKVRKTFHCNRFAWGENNFAPSTLNSRISCIDERSWSQT